MGCCLVKIETKIAIDDTVTNVQIGQVATVNVVANDNNADPTTVELYQN